MSRRFTEAAPCRSTVLASRSQIASGRRSARHFVATLVASVILAASLAACTSDERGPEAAPAAAAGTGEPVTVWTANVKYLQLRWRELVRRMVSRDNGPHLVLLQEVERQDARTLARALGEGLDARFDLRWVEGDNAIVFRTQRFGLGDEPTSEGEALNDLRWFSWGVTARCDQRDRGQIALRLWDREARRNLVVASVRWTHTTAAACMPKNLSTLDSELERSWPRRALTIVGGDFNSVADKRVLGARDLISAGREGDPDCWYRAFTPLLDDGTENARPGERERFCHDVTALNSYYDTVWLSSRPMGADAICDQWTYTRKLKATRGTSCTDTNGDGLRDRSRIDFIWARWEDGRGRPVALSVAEAAKRIVTAGADHACIDEG